MLLAVECLLRRSQSPSRSLRQVNSWQLKSTQHQRAKLTKGFAIRIWKDIFVEKNQEDWRSSITQWITESASNLDDFVDVRIRKIRKRWGRSGVPKIQPYTGYQTNQATYLHGRILSNPPLDPDWSKNDWWDALADTYRRFASDEVPGVKIQASFDGQTIECVSDAEGYFHAAIASKSPSTSAPFWSHAHLKIIDNELTTPDESHTIAKVLSPSETASFMIISDVDDTIMHTGATELLTMAKLTFFNNAKARLPLDGVAKLYQLLQRGGDPAGQPVNPVFYVSSSPWNLYDLLEDFLELNDIPDGPILLRDLGFDRNKFVSGGHDHKLDKIRLLMKAYSGMPVLLFGDSGQEDARLYSTAAEEFGDQIRAIFIRDIDPDVDSKYDSDVAPFIARSEQAGVPMKLIQDSNEAAAFIEDLGLLPKSTRPLIASAVKRDVAR